MVFLVVVVMVIVPYLPSLTAGGNKRDGWIRLCVIARQPFVEGIFAAELAPTRANRDLCSRAQKYPYPAYHPLLATGTGRQTHH